MLAKEMHHYHVPCMNGTVGSQPIHVDEQAQMTVGTVATLRLWDTVWDVIFLSTSTASSSCTVVVPVMKQNSMKPVILINIARAVKFEKARTQHRCNIKGMGLSTASEKLPKAFYLQAHICVKEAIGATP